MKAFLSFLVSLLAIYPSYAQLHGTSPEWGEEVQLPKLTPSSSARGSVGFTTCVDYEGLITNFYSNQFPYPAGGATIRYSQSSDFFRSNTDQVFQPATKTIGACCPNVATDTAGNLHVVWRAQQPFGVYYARFDKTLSSWSDTIRISDTFTYSPHDPTVTVDKLMRVHAMWHDGDPDSAEIAEVMYVQSPDNGINWNTQQMISDNDGNSSAFPRTIMAAVDGDTLAVAWRDHKGPLFQWDVMVGISLDGGTNWNTITAAGGLGTQSDPGIIIDNDGHLHLNYHEYPQGNPFDGARVLAGSSSDLGLTWNSGSFIEISDTFRSHLTVYSYDMVNDAIWVFWKDERDFSGGNPRADIMTAYSEDGGLTYSAPEFITDGDTLSEGLKSASIGLDGKPILVYEFMTGPLGQWTQFLKVRLPVQEELLPKSFFALHCDPPFNWDLLERMVDIGNDHDVPFTFEFHPQWADSILADPNKLSQLRQWEIEGHEVGVHHHGLSHAGARDGFMNSDSTLYIPDFNDAPYRGDMNDYWNLMSQLEGDTAILVGGIDDYNTDWPVQLDFQTAGGRDGWDLSSVVTADTLNGKRVCRIDYTFIEDTTYVDELINTWYPMSNQDSVVGVVTHPFNFGDDSTFFKNWIAFISGKNCQRARDIILASDCPDNSSTCGEVSGLDATKITPNSARLVWDSLPGATAFEIRGRNLSNPNWTSLSVAYSSPQMKDVYGLFNNQTYTWQIQAVCSSDTGVWSVADTFTAGCQAPDTTWTDPVSSNAARLNWSKVSGAMGYRITGQRVGSGSWLTLEVAGANTTQKDVFGLLPSTAYQWIVRAVCDTALNIVSDASPLAGFTTNSLARLSNPEPGFIIVPNPASDWIAIRAPSTDELGELTITSITGALVYTDGAWTDHLEIDISTWPTGIYLVKLGNEVQKLVVE